MTNTILNPVATLDPFLYVSSKQITNDNGALANIGKMQNYLHATYGTGTMIEQHFDHGVFYYNSGTVKTACTWRIPTLSVQHRSFRVVINARGNSVSTFTSVVFTAGAVTTTASSNFTANVDEFKTNVVTLASISNSTTYITVELKVVGQIQVNSIFIEAIELSSISDGRVYQPNGSGYFYPIGDSTLTSDKPLSSAKGYQLLSNIRLLQKRPRMLFCASGVDVNADSGVSNPFNGLTVKPQKTFSYQDLFAMLANLPFWRGALTLDFSYQIYLQLENDVSSVERVYFIYDQKITVPTNTSKWESLLIKQPTIFEDEGKYLSYPLTPFTVSYDQSLDPVLASAIKSISIWGP